MNGYELETIEDWTDFLLDAEYDEDLLNEFKDWLEKEIINNDDYCNIITLLKIAQAAKINENYDLLGYLKDPLFADLDFTGLENVHDAKELISLMNF